MDRELKLLRNTVVLVHLLKHVEINIWTTFWISFGIFTSCVLHCIGSWKDGGDIKYCSNQQL